MVAGHLEKVARVSFSGRLDKRLVKLAWEMEYQAVHAPRKREVKNDSAESREVPLLQLDHATVSYVERWQADFRSGDRLPAASGPHPAGTPSGVGGSRRVSRSSSDSLNSLIQLDPGEVTTLATEGEEAT